MTNLNPADYQNGQPINPPVATGETVNTADPAITLGPAKAIVAAVATALVAGLTALSTALLDNVVTPAEAVTVAIALLVGSGLVGGVTYATRTTVKGN